MGDDINLVLSKNNNIYDEVPYESYSYPMSNLYHLMTTADLFGISPTPVESARVLELGCAAGGNLIPHAINNPNAKFIGIDLSKVEIDEAQNSITKLGLKNIEFYNCSIAEVGANFGKFDYIICHGVISWVPEFIRTKIFEICKKNLTEHGVAYISYNTLPGWNMIRTIRDMMLYHSNMFTNVGEKIQQSRLLLEFVKDSLVNSNAPYAEVLKKEAALLAKQSDYYLCHDHLEENNKQYYFHEFIDNAKKHGLQYLSDCNISTMYLGNMPQKVVEKLQVINDIVRTEQYMDFITNRRFRSTLLCHDSMQLNRKLDNNSLLKYNIFLNLVPEIPIANCNLNDSSEKISFFHNGNRDLKISVSSPIMKAIFYTFSENINNPLNIDTLVSIANQKLKNRSVIEVKSEFVNNSLPLFLQGYLGITLHKPRNKPDLNKPKLAPYVAYQIVNTPKMWVTNLLHEVILLNVFEKIALSYMTGKNNKNQILDALLEHITKGELTISKDGKKVEDQEILHKDVSNFLDATINKAHVSALLV